MRRILMIANTYYQLIMAIQMNDTVFANDEITLLLSDHSKNMEQICARLRESKVFADVHYIKTKSVILCERTTRELYEDRIQFVFGQNNRYAYYLNGIDDLRFDALMYYNHYIDTYGLYCILYQYNKDIEVSLFEEGIMSYDPWLGEGLCERISGIRHALGKKTVQDAFDKFYCLYPSVYSGKLKPIQVPKITRNSRCTDTLRVIFDIDESKLEYPEKYIFFSGMSDLEGGEPVGEYQLACKIADRVGKENLLIKTHPRDTRTIYEENGFKVDKNSAAPWEVMQLTRDFSDKVFMTLTSSTILSECLMTDSSARGYYLFLLCDARKNPLTQRCAFIATNLLNNEELKPAFTQIYVPLHIEDIR